MGLYDRDYMRDDESRQLLPRAIVTLSIVASLVAATAYLLKEFRLAGRTPRSKVIKVEQQSRHQQLLLISPLDLNTATYTEICLLPHVSETTATDILAARPITTVDQLDDVYGIGEKKLAAIRPHVYIDQKTLTQRYPDHKSKK